MARLFNEAVKAQLETWDRVRALEQEMDWELELEFEGDGLDELVAEAARC